MREEDNLIFDTPYSITDRTSTSVKLSFAKAIT